MADLLNLPTFIAEDGNEILTAWQSAYSALVGRQLLPAQTESIMIQMGAYRETVMRSDFNAGGRKMLLDFSTAPLLDFLVALVGVTRLPAQFSTTTLEYSMVVGSTGVTIPAGNRIQSTDGKWVFQTNASTFVPSGTLSISIPATCQAAGIGANGYAVGLVNSMLDPLSFVVSAQNATVTGGGSDSESDAALVSRAKLAPAAFSNAGSYQAYKFWALSANPLIVDCAVLGPNDYSGINPGEVYLYPLIVGGVTPSPILDAVNATCSADNRRPINDLVIVVSPEIISYDLVVSMTLYNNTPNANAVTDSASQRLNDYAQARILEMGMDVMIDQIKAICGQDTSSVYTSAVAINGAPTDLIITPIQVAVIGSITVNIIGYTNG
jgi:phage-related baseplate assembly protein